jgi:hypothetical protein
VIDENYRTVAPVEEWLEANRHLWSPNTVRGYATSLAQWWTFLEQGSLSRFPCKPRVTNTVNLSQGKSSWEEDDQRV